MLMRWKNGMRDVVYFDSAGRIIRNIQSSMYICMYLVAKLQDHSGQLAGVSDLETLNVVFLACSGCTIGSGADKPG